ncbi:hypothetical protein [Eubacterium sp. 1001713B170207_170306_E7]|uniref:hypothetical protein n=1 Tax=Eubacterium sp. 1001713B170207_170306_E7 TaxID=2787097 RepID=UPI0018983D50|nr:hypothetical protein [Eubacterium sp. 1001713B170207_170306_E7]
MNLYALKSDNGYLKTAPDGSYTLVGINKASVFDDSRLDSLKDQLTALKPELPNLRIVKLVLEEVDYFWK